MEPKLVHFAKSDNPNFNYEAAQRAYDLVMKMDLDEARIFTTMVVGDEVVELIEKNQRSLQAHLNKVVAKRLGEYSNGIKRTVIKKRMAGQEFDEEDALATAGAVGLIAKAIKNPYAYGYVFDENDFRRDPRTGRFTTKI